MWQLLGKQVKSTPKASISYEECAGEGTVKHHVSPHTRTWLNDCVSIGPSSDYGFSWDQIRVCTLTGEPLSSLRECRLPELYSSHHTFSFRGVWGSHLCWAMSTQCFLRKHWQTGTNRHLTEAGQHWDAQSLCCWHTGLMTSWCKGVCSLL